MLRILRRQKDICLYAYYKVVAAGAYHWYDLVRSERLRRVTDKRAASITKGGRKLLYDIQ